MLNNFLKNRAVNTFLLLTVGVFGIMLFLLLLNNRFWLNDFKVMYMAAKALMNNGQVYGVPFGLGSGFYKYSPFTLLFFVPYTLFSYKIACLLHFTVITLVTAAEVVLLHNIIGKYLFGIKKQTAIILFIILFSIMLHMERELHLGNTNMILLFLSTLAVKFMLQDKFIKSGALWAIVVLTKPYLVVCLLPLLLYKKWSVIISGLGAGVVFVLGSIILVGFSKGIALYFAWVPAMLKHSDYITSTHTVYSIANTYFGIQIPVSYYAPLFVLLGFLSLGLFWYIDYRAEKNAANTIDRTKSLILNIFVLIALSPSFMLTDKEHFLFLLPLLTIIILQLQNKPKVLWITLFAIVMILYEGNSIEVIGRNMSIVFDDYGFIGIGNLIIVGTVIYLYSKKRDLWVLKKSQQ